MAGQRMERFVAVIGAKRKAMRNTIRRRSIRKLARKVQVPFDLNGPYFTGVECSELSGVSREIIDNWVSRGVLVPTRRLYPSRRSRGRIRKRYRRPMFSVVAIFRVRLARELGRYLKIGLSEWLSLGGEAERAKNKFELTMSARIAGISAEQNWMRAVAMAIENGKDLNVYGYATYDKSKWLFDMHVGNELKSPHVRTDIPHICIPMSAIFSTVYIGCKKSLIGSRQTHPS